MGEGKTGNEKGGFIKWLKGKQEMKREVLLDG